MQKQIVQKTDSAEENVTEDVLTVEYDAETPAPAAEKNRLAGRRKMTDGITITMMEV